jgi:hypothetical protein
MKATGTRIDGLEKVIPEVFGSGIQLVAPRNHGCPTETLGHDEANLERVKSTMPKKATKISWPPAQTGKS